MKLLQLRYILGVARNELNISRTAESLFTSQPGVSKQIRMLEDELGIEIFERSGKMLSGITPIGQTVIDMAEEVADKIEGIKRIASEYNSNTSGDLTIATTHCQARYMLPNIILEFTEQFPTISFHMEQGTPIQICESVAKDAVDIAIATEAMELFDNLIIIPCYKWNRTVIVKPDHPLANAKSLSLQDLVRYPLVTYIKGFTGRYQLDQSFENAGLKPNIMFTASDSDIIKAYVRMDLGVGIIAGLAYNDDLDSDLVSINASHLFPPSETRIGIKRGTTLRSFMYEFIKLVAPYLTDEIIDKVMKTKTNLQAKKIFDDISIPHY